MIRILLAAAMVFMAAACGPQSEATADKAATEPSAQSPAKCKPEPPAEAMACTMEWRPVCGCDGVTYSNACSAKAAGVPEFTEGECAGKKRDTST
jgi:hypothetical protein